MERGGSRRRQPVGPDPLRGGRTTAGWAGLALVVLWVVLSAAALSSANALSAADLNGSGAPRHPLADPSPAVARAEFVVGLIGVAALPTAIAVVALGYRGVLRGSVVGRRVGWVTLVTGAAALLPALAATLLGVVIVVLDAGALGGAD